jgi:uncharacterized protein (DUF2252 family)
VIVAGAESPEQSARRGRAARAHVPRSAHARLELDDDRRNPLRIIEARDAARAPELAPLRHGRMLASPWGFFRGAAAVMAADLVHTPATGLPVQLCGDAHAGNFAGFAVPGGRAAFDLSDFDETLPGPWEWDLKRLAASLAVAGRERGAQRDRRTDAVRAAAREYRDGMRDFARMGALDVWYAELGFERDLVKAQAKENARAFSRLAQVVDETARFVADPPWLVPVRDLVPDAEVGPLETRLHAVLAGYRAALPADRRRLLDGYRPVDFARKVSAAGDRSWIALLSAESGDDPLFLQIRESTRSALEPYAGRSEFAGDGERVVEGQRLMQSTGDILLGWMRDAGSPGERPRDYYVRQLWTAHPAPPIDALAARELVAFARVCGWTLARAHARSGDRAAIAGYLGRGDHFERALSRFAEAYADRNERDHAAFAAAVRSGRIAAEPAS